MRLRGLPVFIAAVLLAAACGGGGKCDRCSADADCDQGKGYVCERYADDVYRCGDPALRFDECPAQ